jgi:hypothetical protein
MKNKVHKTCPTWGRTQCGKEVWECNPKTSYRWCDVTCKTCIKQKQPRSDALRRDA